MDREKEKRKYIGKYLLDNTDLVIFTMDDPRYENVDYIIDDMILISNKTNYKRIISRSNAIKYALDIAKEDDAEIEIGVQLEDYKIKRGFFKKLREMKYYILENKLYSE